jgi:hypothetical protein
LVRPLPRKHKDTLLAATLPDETYSWVEDKREIRVEVWRNLILNKIIPSKNNQTFDVYAFYDPDFDQPWLLATPVRSNQRACVPSAKTAGRWNKCRSDKRERTRKLSFCVFRVNQRSSASHCILNFELGGFIPGQILNFGGRVCGRKLSTNEKSRTPALVQAKTSGRSQCMEMVSTGSTHRLRTGRALLV